MTHLRLVALLVVVAACGGTTTTAPAPPPTGYRTISEMQVVDPATHRLRTVPPAAYASGISASYVGGASQPAVVVAATDPGVARHGGHLNYQGTDASGHLVNAIVFYRATGGPPASTYQFRDRKLVATTAFSWVAIRGGWYMSRAYMQVLKPTGGVAGSYTLTGTYTQTTLPCDPRVNASCPPAQIVRGPVHPARRLLGYAALGLAYVCAPADALAQFGMHFGDCFREWLLYASAVGGLYAAAGLAPDGIGLAMMGGAFAAATVALKDLVDCMVAHDLSATNGTLGSGGGATGSGGSDATCDNGGLSCPVVYSE